MKVSFTDVYHSSQSLCFTPLKSRQINITDYTVLAVTAMNTACSAVHSHLTNLTKSCKSIELSCNYSDSSCVLNNN